MLLVEFNIPIERHSNRQNGAEVIDMYYYNNKPFCFASCNYASSLSDGIWTDYKNRIARNRTSR